MVNFNWAFIAYTKWLKEAIFSIITQPLALIVSKTAKIHELDQPSTAPNKLWLTLIQQYIANLSLFEGNTDETTAKKKNRLYRKVAN